MSIKEYELFHGAVLAKLVRGKNHVRLSLIETNTRDSWSVYMFNDEKVFFKHNSSPKILKGGGTSWLFHFTENQMKKLNSGDTHLALVCGNTDTRSGNMEICFIENSNVSELLTSDVNNLTVRLDPRQSFRVSSGAFKGSKTIPRNAIDSYEFPA